MYNHTTSKISDVKFNNFNNKINVNTLRIKILADELMETENIQKLRFLDEETLMKINGTLDNIAKALSDVKNNLGFGSVFR